MVASAMGGMGRQFEGGYAEYTCPPASQVQKIDVKPAVGDARRDAGDAGDCMGFAVTTYTAWRRVQSRANRSPPEFPLTGKDTGNFFDFFLDTPLRGGGTPIAMDSGHLPPL